MGVRSEGASLKYEYNAREGIYSKGSRGEELVYKGSENMPEFAKDNPRFFWQCAEKFERADGNQYRKIEFSLPHELNIKENVALAKTYAEKLLGDEYVYSIAIHNKLSREGDVQNIHCHIMFSERKLDGIERSYDKFFKQPNHGGLRKDRDWWKRSTLYNVRELWEETLNEKLEERGIEKVSSMSLKKQQEAAIKRGDFLKAEMLNRESVNLDGKLLQLADKDIRELTEDQRKAVETFNLNREIKRIKEEQYRIKVADLEKIKISSEIKVEVTEERTVLNNQLLNEMNKYKDYSQPERLRDITMFGLTGKKYSDIKKEFNELNKEKPKGFLQKTFIIWKNQERYEILKSYLDKWKTPEMLERVRAKENELLNKYQERISILDQQINALNIGTKDIKIEVQPFKIEDLDTKLVRPSEEPLNLESKPEAQELFKTIMERELLKQKLLRTMVNIEKKAKSKNIEQMVKQTLSKGQFRRMREREAYLEGVIGNSYPRDPAPEILKERQEIREYFRSFKTPEMKSKIIAKTDQIIKKYEAAYEKASEEYDLLNSSSLQLKEAIDSLSEVDKKYLVQENNQRIDLLKAEKVKVDSLVEKQKAIKDPEVIKREIYDSLTSGVYSKTLEAINHNEFHIKRSKPGSSDEAALLRELEQNKAFIKEIHKLDISGKFNEIYSARSSVFKELRVHQDAINGELRLAVDKNNALFRADLKKEPLTEKGYRKGNRKKYTPKKSRVNTGTLKTGKLFNTKNVEEEEIERDIEF